MLVHVGLIDYTVVKKLSIFDNTLRLGRLFSRFIYIS